MTERDLYEAVIWQRKDAGPWKLRRRGFLAESSAAARRRAVAAMERLILQGLGGESQVTVHSPAAQKDSELRAQMRDQG